MDESMAQNTPLHARETKLELFKEVSPFLEYITMKMFSMKYFQHDNYSIAFQFPLKKLEESCFVSLFQHFFETVSVRNQCVSLKNLQKEIIANLEKGIEKKTIDNPYLKIIIYLQNQPKVTEDGESLPTIFNGFLVEDEQDWNDEASQVISKENIFQKQDCEMEDLKVVMQQIVNEYWLLHTLKGKETVVSISLPNLYYSKSVEDIIKKLFFPYFQSIQVSTFYYNEVLYINKIRVRHPREMKKVNWAALLLEGR